MRGNSARRSDARFGRYALIGKLDALLVSDVPSVHTPPVADSDQALAEALATQFQAQVDAFYAIPRKHRPRDRIVFSPSGVTKCARELYYAHSGAIYDTEPLIAWRERRNRNGEAVHVATQNDLFKLEESLRGIGVTPRFRFLEAEISGEKSYSVNGRTVTIRGRADGKIAVLDDTGDKEMEIIGFEFKTKTRREQLTKIVKSGPQLDHTAQTVAYSLIWGVRKWLFVYHCLQTPKWNEVEGIDQVAFLTEVEEEQERRLLVKLSKVVEAIEEKALPAAELDKCGFCRFKTQCRADGGYKGEVNV